MEITRRSECTEYIIKVMNTTVFCNPVVPAYRIWMKFNIKIHPRLERRVVSMFVNCIYNTGEILVLGKVLERFNHKVI